MAGSGGGNIDRLSKNREIALLHCFDQVQIMIMRRAIFRSLPNSPSFSTEHVFLKCFHGNSFLIFNRSVWPCIARDEQARAILKTLLSQV